MAFFNSPTIHTALESEKNLLSYSIAGAVVGLVTSLIISVFKVLLELPARLWFPDAEAESFESLAITWRFLLPVVGAVILSISFYALKLQHVRTGLPFTVFAVNKLHSNFPIKNTITQFFGAIAALGSGFSVGQEGPAVHLGAASACHIAKQYHVPQNNLRIFAGCGVAAAIAAVFDTPLAGVVFAMEVVLLEYTIAGFAPVIMAAITATTVHKLINQDPMVEIVSLTGTLALQDQVWLFVIAVCITLVSAAFVASTRLCLKLNRFPLWAKFLFTGVLTGTVAMAFPQVMGTGSDTITSLYFGSSDWQLLVWLLLAKLVATSAAVAVGIPGGLIGPSLFMGACVGGLFSAVATAIDPTLASHAPIYVLLGMAGMMSAAINAPLAAIIFIVELSFLPGLVFPGLIVVLLTNVGHQSVFRLPSIVQLIFEHQGVDLNTTSFQRALSKRNVMQLLNNRCVELKNRDAFEHEEDKDFFVVREAQAYAVGPIKKHGKAFDTANQRWSTAGSINTTATAFQAWRQLEKTGADYLVCERRLRDETIVIGVLARQSLIDYVLH